jgi:hypothetical protein
MRQRPVHRVGLKRGVPRLVITFNQKSRRAAEGEFFLLCSRRDKQQGLRTCWQTRRREVRMHGEPAERVLQRRGNGISHMQTLREEKRGSQRASTARANLLLR